MASSLVSSGILAARRKKQHTYGRQARRTMEAFQEEFGTHNDSNSNTMPRDVLPVAKSPKLHMLARSQTKKNAKPPLDQGSVFDVPSSDEDEVELSQRKIVSKSARTTPRAHSNGSLGRLPTSGSRPSERKEVVPQHDASPGLLRPTKRLKLSSSPDVPATVLSTKTQRTLPVQGSPAGKMQMTKVTTLRRFGPEAHGHTVEDKSHIPLVKHADTNRLITNEKAQQKDTKVDQRRLTHDANTAFRRSAAQVSTSPNLIVVGDRLCGRDDISMRDHFNNGDQTLSSTPRRLTPEPRTKSDSKTITRSDLSMTPTKPALIRQPSSTPKQVKLWNALLSDGDHDSSEDKLTTSPTRSLTFTAASSTNTQRSRLIDSLYGQSIVPSSDDDLEGVLLPSHTQSDSQASQSGSLVGPQAYQPEKMARLQRPALSRSQSRVTYSGQRSFLDDSALGFDELLSQPLDPEPVPLMAKPPSQVLSQSQTFSMFDIDEDDGAIDGPKGMKSIHELRAAGDSFSFDHDLLIDDIERPGKQFLSQKRSALLNICCKLGKADFRERFTRTGLELRLLLACRGEQDVLIGTSMAAILIYVLQAQPTTKSALQLAESGALDLLIPLLDHNIELPRIARDRKTNMSKVAQASVTDFQDSFISANVLEDSSSLTSLSPRILGLKAWELVIRRMRSEGDMTTLLSSAQLSKLLYIFEAIVQELAAKQQSASGRTPIILTTALSLLECLTVAEACTMDESLWDVDTMTRIVKCLNQAMTAQSCSNEAGVVLTLRACLNLANNHAAISDTFASSDFVRQILVLIGEGFGLPTGERNSMAQVQIDKLLLCLGVMLNLAEWSEKARLAVLNYEAPIDLLLCIFLESRKKAQEAESLAASTLNVAYGYLAVVLGNLCRTERVRDYIGERLQTGSFSVIGTAVQEFLQHHKEADKFSEDNESWSAFTERLSAVQDMLEDWA